MQVFYATQFVLPLPAGHRFPMAKYQLLRDRLAAALPDVRLQQAQPASDGELALAHTPAYIAAIADGSVAPADPARNRLSLERGHGRAGAPVGGRHHRGLPRRASEGVAANIAGGTHHAYAPTRAAGFACSTMPPWRPG
jgi:acetoin utilization deacetylase AcuC-like enzyme